MNQEFCLLCSEGNPGKEKTTICDQCSLLIDAHHCVKDRDVLFCTTCIANLRHKSAVTDPMSILCGSCLSNLLELRKDSSRRPVDLYLRLQVPLETVMCTVLDQSEDGYIIKVRNLTDDGCLVTQEKLSIGDSFEVYYAGVEQGKQIFALVPGKYPYRS